MSLTEDLKTFSDKIKNKKYNFNIEKLKESPSGREIYAIDGSQIELLNFGSVSVFAFRAGFRGYKNLIKTSEYIIPPDKQFIEKEIATMQRRRVEMEALKKLVQKASPESLIVLDGSFETYEKGLGVLDELKKHNLMIGLSKRTSLFGLVIYYLQKMNYTPPYLAFINPSEIGLSEDYNYNVGFINFNGLCFRIDWPKNMDKETLLSLCSEMVPYTKESECLGYFYPQFAIHSRVKFKGYEKSDLRMEVIKEMSSSDFPLDMLLKYDDFYKTMGRI